jgi:hypothetical protein
VLLPISSVWVVPFGMVAVTLTPDGAVTVTVLPIR